MSLQWESTIPRKTAVKLNVMHLLSTTGTWIVGLILMLSFLAYLNDRGAMFTFFISCIFILLLLSGGFIVTTVKNTKELYGDKTSVTVAFQLDDDTFSFKSERGSTAVNVASIKKVSTSGEMIVVELLGGRSLMMVKRDTPQEFLDVVCHVKSTNKPSPYPTRSE